MTLDERIAAVARHGFTTRQAAFLTTVMLHAGVCAQRQYAAFAGLANGHTTREFFDGLLARRFATAHPCWQQGGARLYHLHHKGLYRAIGEPDNRHRRKVPVARAIERLMVLDAVLAHPETQWLATEREKVTYFAAAHGVPTSEMPALVFDARGRRTERYFPDKLPIGVQANGPGVTFLFLVVDEEALAFREFLARHRQLLRRVPRWTIRVVFPSFLAASRTVHEAAFSAFCAPPLRPAVVDEFRWFCATRRALEGEQRRIERTDETRYRAARRAFGGPRFYAAYRRWLAEGDAAFGDLLSPVLHERHRRREIECEHHVLSHHYHHLAPAMATA